MIDRQNYIFRLLEMPWKIKFLGKTGNNESHQSKHLSDMFGRKNIRHYIEEKGINQQELPIVSIFCVYENASSQAR
jgi:hypothetical protein